MKRILKICSVSVLAILACSVLLIKFRRKDIHSSKSGEKVKEECPPLSDVDKNDLPANEFEVSKKETLNTMKERHAEAAEIVKDSVENIFKNIEVKNDGTQELDSISDELDKLLNEED